MGKDPHDGKRSKLDGPPKGKSAPVRQEDSSDEAKIPTIIPAFDPTAFAESSEVRGQMPTLTDDAALEQARLQSLPSNRPPRSPASTMPGPLHADPKDTGIEVDADEAELDALSPEEQVAILRDHLMPLTRVPRLAQSMTELGALLADPKTAYVLGFVDGILPLETIIDVTGLPEIDTLNVLDRMVQQGVLVFTRPSSGRPRRTR